jgi:hypothetical protein
MHHFLWAGDNEVTRGKCKIAWSLIARPIQFGGMGGFLDLNIFNIALRLRWLWFAWTSPGCPWNGSELPVDSADIALFTATTRVWFIMEARHLSGARARSTNMLQQCYARFSLATADERTGQLEIQF